MAVPGIPPVPYAPADYSTDWALPLSTTVNLLVGKANNVRDFTLAAGATTTDILDPRLTATSVLTFMPLTANAAAIQASIWVNGRGKGNCTVHHSSTLNTDQTFGIAFHG